MIAAGIINKSNMIITIRHKTKSGVAVIEQQLELINAQEESECNKPERRLMN